jgi:uncharacterized membrane protein YccC
MFESVARTWVTRHKPKLWLALRMTVSSAAAFVVASALELPQGYWSVLTALIVTETSVGGSLKVAVDRLVASLCGAIYGAAVTFLLPHHEPWSVGIALLVAVAPLAALAAFNASFRVAPITAIIVLLSTTASTLGPLGYAVERVVEIALGCTIGLAVSALLAPARAYNLVLEATAQTTALLAEQLDALAVAVRDPVPHLGELHDKVRKGLNKLETLADEAARERRNRLSDEPDPEPLYRTLRRLRHDIGALNRALTEPFPEVLQEHFAELWLRFARAAAEALRGLGAALARRQAPVGLDSVTQAISDYKGAVDAVRAAGLTRGLGADGVARVFGIAFMLDQMRINLGDLASRAVESARAV